MRNRKPYESLSWNTLPNLHGNKALRDRFIGHIVDMTDPDECFEFETKQSGEVINFWLAELKMALPIQRIAWAFAHGEIPKGCAVRVVCQNSKCVNPNHLQLRVHAFDVDLGELGIPTYRWGLNNRDREQFSEVIDWPTYPEWFEVWEKRKETNNAVFKKATTGCTRSKARSRGARSGTRRQNHNAAIQSTRSNKRATASG